MTDTGQNTSTAHMAWCAMIALHIARQDGKAGSEAQENTFLTRWLAEARRPAVFRARLPRTSTGC